MWNFSTEWMLEKSQRVPPFTFSALWDYSKFLFLSDIRFSQYISTKTFFRYYPNFWPYIQSELRFTTKKVEVQKHCAISNFWHCIWTILRFTREELEVRKKRSMWPSELYPNFWRVLRSRKAPYGCFDTFWKFFKKVLSIFLKLCAFWALNIAPTLDVPVLFTAFYKHSLRNSFGDTWEKGRPLSFSGFWHRLSSGTVTRYSSMYRLRPFVLLSHVNEVDLMSLKLQSRLFIFQKNFQVDINVFWNSAFKILVVIMIHNRNVTKSFFSNMSECFWNFFSS